MATVTDENVGYCDSATGGATTTSNVWRHWVVSGTITTSSTSDNIVWNTWVDGTNTATTTNVTVTTGTGGNGVWEYWISNDGGNAHVVNRPYQETAEQRQAREAQQRTWAENEKKKKEDQEKSNKRAMELFNSIVGKDRAKRFQERGYHEVRGQSGIRYRLSPSKRIEVMRGDIGDQVDADLCIHHTYDTGLPPMDTLIHQMLCIMAEEETLIRTANRTQRMAA